MHECQYIIFSSARHSNFQVMDLNLGSVSLYGYTTYLYVYVHCATSIIFHPP